MGTKLLVLMTLLDKMKFSTKNMKTDIKYRYRKVIPVYIYRNRGIFLRENV